MVRGYWLVNVDLGADQRTNKIAWDLVRLSEGVTPGCAFDIDCEFTALPTDTVLPSTVRTDECLLQATSTTLAQGLVASCVYIADGDVGEQPANDKV